MVVYWIDYACKQLESSMDYDVNVFFFKQSVLIFFNVISSYMSYMYVLLTLDFVLI